MLIASMALGLAMTVSETGIASCNESTVMSQYTLTITGRCPGPITIYWWNATPDRRHAFLLAHEGGNAVIPYGPCAGTVLGLGERGLQFGMILPTGHGNGKIKAIMGNGACGYFVQLLEIPTCRTSNVARTP